MRSIARQPSDQSATAIGQLYVPLERLSGGSRWPLHPLVLKTIDVPVRRSARQRNTGAIVCWRNIANRSMLGKSCALDSRRSRPSTDGSSFVQSISAQALRQRAVANACRAGRTPESPSPDRAQGATRDGGTADCSPVDLPPREPLPEVRRATIPRRTRDAPDQHQVVPRRIRERRRRAPRIRIQVRPTSEPDRVLGDEPPQPRVVVPRTMERQPCTVELPTREPQIRTADLARHAPPRRTDRTTTAPTPSRPHHPDPPGNPTDPSAPHRCRPHASERTTGPSRRTTTRPRPAPDRPARPRGWPPRPGTPCERSRRPRGPPTRRRVAEPQLFVPSVDRDQPSQLVPHERPRPVRQQVPVRVVREGDSRRLHQPVLPGVACRPPTRSTTAGATSSN